MRQELGVRCAIGITGNNGPISPDFFTGLPGVVQCLPVTKPYKLISREIRQEDTVIQLDDLKIGGKELTVIAGPCAVENEAQIFMIGRQLAKMGGASTARRRIQAPNVPVRLPGTG